MMAIAAATHHFPSASAFLLQLRTCPRPRTLCASRAPVHPHGKRITEGAALPRASPITLAIRHKPKVVVPKVRAAELDRLLSQAGRMPLLLSFYATWCGPCILMTQDIELLQLEYSGRVRFLRVDTDEEYVLAQNMDIRGLPTLVFISSDPSEPVVRMEGLVPGYVVRSVINKGLKVLQDAAPAVPIQHLQVSDSVPSNNNVD